MQSIISLWEIPSQDNTVPSNNLFTFFQFFSWKSNTLLWKLLVPYYLAVPTFRDVGIVFTAFNITKYPTTLPISLTHLLFLNHITYFISELFICDYPFFYKTLKIFNRKLKQKSFPLKINEFGCKWKCFYLMKCNYLNWTYFPLPKSCR